jgi:hypothetical protein
MAIGRAKNPAAATADDNQEDTRSAEQGSDNLAHDPEPEPAPEPDSHDDLVRRVKALEFRIF